MRVVVVDTDVLSFIFKNDTRGGWYEQHLQGGLGSISFMTIAELDYWAASRNWGERRKAELALFLRRFAVIDSTRQLCSKWAEVRDRARRMGSNIQPSDAWIAATALLYEVPLLTHNADDFVWITDLTVISSPQK